jgi:6-phosphogluconolactonase
MPFAYISNAASGDIHVYHVSDDGLMSSTEVDRLGGNLAPMAINPSKKLLYVARRGDSCALISLDINANTGKLKIRAETPVDAKMSYIGIDRTGQYLVGVSYHSHSLTVCKLDPSNTILPNQTVISTRKHPHSIQFTQDNQHALVASLGDDEMLVYAFDENSGGLTALEANTWKAKPGSGPRHIQFHPNGQFVYVLNELDATLDVLRWNHSSAKLHLLQTLETLPESFTGKAWAADIHLTPDGRFLYTSDRNSSTLALFVLNADKGLATFIENTPTELQPRSFAISPSGSHLMAAGQKSDHVSLYRIDPLTGKLKLQQRLPTGTEPIWIEII